MPTGYSKIVSDGGSLEDFALSCARAFFYDCDKVPERVEAAPYYRERLDRTQARVEQLLGADPDKAAADYLAEENPRRARHLAEYQQEVDRYRAMLGQVQNWIVPAPLARLKTLMLEQLEAGHPWDTSEYDQPVIIGDNKKWLDEQLQDAVADRDRAAVDLDKEIANVKVKNEWLDLLRKTLAK